MRKINLGAGTRWKCADWEILDNGGGEYSAEWMHFGNIWETGLPSGVFDIVFTSHTLEHIPHFFAERAIAEINRIMKKGGVVRISVPDLEKAVRAYCAGDEAYFRNEETMHDSSHLGIGGMLMNQIVSPGGQTFAFNRDMEPIGTYAHLYNYDFNMMKILLEKWGFCQVVKSEYCGSAVLEMRNPTVIVHGDMQYDEIDEKGKKIIKSDDASYFTGFDNKKTISLYVEAIKEKDVPYSYGMEFAYNKRSRLQHEKLWKIKAPLFKYISKMIDSAHGWYAMAARRR